MCAIVGLWRRQTGDPAQQIVAMRDRLRHRGPDDAGIYVSQNGMCALGHRRLAVVDLTPGGAQPMIAPDGNSVLVFNGEIYNHHRLRARLIEQGHIFKGASDTEVLLHLLTHEGVEAVLPRLDGAFAFAFYDQRRDMLTLARDPFGEKPLYTARLPDGALAFASEASAFTVLPDFDRTVSVEALGAYLTFGHVPAPACIYAMAQKVPAGSGVQVDAQGAQRAWRYFAFAPAASVASVFESVSMEEAVEQLEPLLLESLRRRLLADVPVGLLLSGGVDSSLIAALATRRLNRSLQTFSIGFRGARHSEHPTARAFSRLCGTQHHELLLSGKDLLDFFAHIGAQLDEPNADTSLFPYAALAGLAREHVTVALSGDGGDELFAGYPRYGAIAARPQNAGVDYYGRYTLLGTPEWSESLLGTPLPQLHACIGLLRKKIDDATHAPQTLNAALRATDGEYFLAGVLAKVDRMSMAHALEVRTPFLNTELVRFAERLPIKTLMRGNQGKQVLRQLGTHELPARLMHLPKRGFALPDVPEFAQAFAGIAQQALGAPSRVRAAFGDAAMAGLLHPQARLEHVWSVVILEQWLQARDAVLPPLTRVLDAPPMPQWSLRQRVKKILAQR